MPEPIPSFFAAILGGLVAAIIGAVVTLTAQRSQHTHERAMALQVRRAVAYERLLTHASCVALWVERTGALLQPAEPAAPPEKLPDAELAALNAAARIHSSPKVLALTMAFGDAARAFRDCAEAVHYEQEHHSDRSQVVRENRDAARKAFFDALAELGARANEELRGEAAAA
jgi:hypothetical protein